ncbi:hypothetical protein HMPREF1869_01233 [Bacteroidales bacterium KA00251]|nr:hypothetical protein HMPREF1869_01233 [Bacteroidales bacterium KA00251]
MRFKSIVELFTLIACGVGWRCSTFLDVYFIYAIGIKEGLFSLLEGIRCLREGVILQKKESLLCSTNITTFA